MDDDRELRVLALEASLRIKGSVNSVDQVLRSAERFYAFLLSGRPSYEVS